MISICSNTLDRVGYPKWLEDEKNIDRFYEELNLSSTNTHLLNMMLVRRFQKQQNFKKLVNHSVIKRNS